MNSKLSEFRAYIFEGGVTAISQTAFYHSNHSGIMDYALISLAEKVRRLWNAISSELEFTSCALDIYAEVGEEDFEVRLIEINPWGAHLGSGSLLFHWLDDAHILSYQHETVVRIVEDDREPPALTFDEICKIGRGTILYDELRHLRKKKLKWILENVYHKGFSKRKVKGNPMRVATRADGLKWIRRLDKMERGEVIEGGNEFKPKTHLKYRRLQEYSWEEDEESAEDVDGWGWW